MMELSGMGSYNERESKGDFLYVHILVEGELRLQKWSLWL